MPATALKHGAAKELERLFGLLAKAISETLGSLIAHELVAKAGDCELVDAPAILGSINGECAVVRGGLDKDYTGKIVYVLLEAADAVAMAGMLMMTPDDVVAERRARGTLEGEEAEAFGEIGNVLCSGFGNVLREQVANIDIRLLDHGVVKPGRDEKVLLAAGPLVCCKLQIKVANLPETIGRIIVDQATAEAWNKGPIDLGTTGADAAAAATAEAGDQQKVEDSLEDIPAAAIRGVLNAYVAANDVYRLLRRSCRRIGLELRRHGRTEIPNPAAHKGEIVVLDVPTGALKRLDWCKRLKSYPGGQKVVLLLHGPSRALVMQAFLSQADVILGWPVDEALLSTKLNDLLAGPVP